MSANELIAKLVTALQVSCVWLDDEGHGCYRCGGEWGRDEAPRHKPECVLAEAYAVLEKAKCG